MSTLSILTENHEMLMQAQPAISAEATIGEIVRRSPATSRVFEDLKIDYCCGGKRPLAEVCTEAGLNTDEVMGRIRTVMQGAYHSPSESSTRHGGQDYANTAEWPLSMQVDHIVGTHHVYLKDELPRILALSEKVANAHGKRDERLQKIREAVAPFVAEMSAHMQKEELMLFPMIKQIDEGAPGPWFQQGSIKQPIDRMELEHQDAGSVLADLRGLMDDFTPPDWACNSYRALLQRLDDLERDLHQHVHKENNVLFPMALQAEHALRVQGTVSADQTASLEQVQDL